MNKLEVPYLQKTKCLFNSYVNYELIFSQRHFICICLCIHYFSLLILDFFRIRHNLPLLISKCEFLACQIPLQSLLDFDVWTYFILIC